MARKKFTYDDRRYLDTLVMCIEGKHCKLDATLMPDVPEFIDAVTQTNFFNKSSGITERNHENLGDNNLRIIRLLQLCESHSIMPFWSFNFDNNPSQWRAPKIQYIGPSGGSVYSEPYKTCVHPFWFTQNRKWHKIRLEDYRGEESVEAAKVAVAEFIHQGYVVTDLHAKLNPRIRTADHYCDYEKCDAELWAHDGVIEITNVPDGFELPKEPRRIEKKPQCLENFIAGFLARQSKI